MWDTCLCQILFCCFSFVQLKQNWQENIQWFYLSKRTLHKIQNGNVWMGKGNSSIVRNQWKSVISQHLTVYFYFLPNSRQLQRRKREIPDIVVCKTYTHKYKSTQKIIKHKHRKQNMHSFVEVLHTCISLVEVGLELG